MWNVTRHSLLALCLLTSLTVQAAMEDCTIVIRSKRRNGSREVIRFISELPSKAQCRKLAEIHSVNGEPEKFIEKHVFYRWKHDTELAFKH